MTISIPLDKNLINDTLKLARCRSLRAMVDDAVREYAQKRKRLRIFELAGTIDFDPSYDYKAARRRGIRKSW